MPLGVVDTVGGDLPLPIGGGVAVGVAPSDVDVLVDHTPFWLNIGPETPYERASAPFQREQVDQQPEAGEQSLAGWWTRSQLSFHFGAGLDYLDTSARPDEVDRLRYKTSRNVNPWTPGVVSRLNGTTLERATAAAEPVWVEAFDNGWIVAVSASDIEVWNGTTWTNVPQGATAQHACSDGTNLYIAYPDAIWKIAGADAATPGAWSGLYSYASSALPLRLGWVKQRLMFGRGASVYELDTNAAAAALPTAQMVHPTSTWRWTSFSDSPRGILASGYAGLSSCIYSFGIEDISGAPVLGGGVPLTTLPVGERVLCSLFYVGSLLVLGTNRGVRVCQFDSFSGGLQLGPLSVETEADVTALGGYDRYVFAGTLVAGETSLVRLDLSAPLDQAGHYAWAPDLVFPDDASWTEAVTGITFAASGLKAIGVTGHGLVLEDDETNPAESAWLQTARIRMATVEDKVWAYASLRGTYGEDAPIGVSLQTPTDAEFDNVYVTTSNTERFQLRATRGEWLALRFDFAEGADLSSYRVQALPGAPRQRLISLPMWLTDYQITRSGVSVGYPGWALSRLGTLEALEMDGAEITVSAPALFPEAVRGVIERLSFTQIDDAGDQGSGTGGHLQLVLRTTS